MNNPDSGSQFLSPLRTQPLKKQRGGATPDVAHRSTSRQPLTAGSGASGVSANESAQEAIARRRAELRRLQGLREARADAKRPEVTLASHALASSTSGGPPPPMIPGPPQGGSHSGSGASASASGPPKPPGGGVARHHSDIFPAVHKSPARERKAVPDLAKPSAPLPSLPTMRMKESPGRTTPSSSQRQPVPPKGPPPTPTSSSRSRAKSAPPVRPPPPPSPAATLQGPPTVPASTTVRPFPISPGSLSLEPSRRQEDDDPAATLSLTTPLLSPPKWIEQDGKIIPLSPVPPKPLPPPPPHNKTLPPMAPSLPTMDRTPRDSKSVGLAPRATTAVRSAAAATTTAAAVAATPSRSSNPSTTTAVEEEDNEEAKTPAPVHTPMVPPISASRRERLSYMRAGLDPSTTTTALTKELDQQDNTSSAPSSPSTKPPSSATAALLEQTLKETMEDKRMALQQIKLLEEELLKARQKELQALQQQPPPTPMTTTGALLTQAPKPLQKMLQLADVEGEAAAWKWAKSQVAGVPPLSSIESPLRPSSAAVGSGSGGPSSASSILHAMALLKPPPQPKLFANSEDSQPNMVMMERQLIQFFREAVECVTLEYESDLATFFVRRPYGMEPIPSPLFAHVVDGSLVDDCAVYSKQAHITTVSTLQVAGVVKANGSDFLLSGVCDLKYQANPNDGEAEGVDDEWSYLSLDRPSPTSSMVVTYIDNEGVERDWCPQLILEEALNVRDQYCRAITSTAVGFKDRPPVPAAAPPVLAISEEKPMTVEMAVDTSDIPTDDVPPPASKATASVVEKEGKESVPTKPPPAPQPEEEVGSGDVLAVFLGVVFRSIWNLVYWLLIGLPLAILRGSIVCAFVVAILSTVYLHLVETHHNGQALSMWGATSGGYHSNAAIGIL